MATLFPRPIQIRRRTGSYVRGVWTPATDTLYTATGSCQPVTGRAIDSLPANRRDVGQIKIYTNERLNVSTEGTANSGDVVEWDGNLWEVWESEPNQNGLISHFKSLAQYIGKVAP